MHRDYEDEEWRPIDGYPNYAISDCGRVMSIRRQCLMLPRYNRVTGYMYAFLWHEGVRKQYSIHRLVALAFLGSPSEKLDVNHLDGDKTNNEVWNLEWVTRGDNQRHAYRTGLREPVRNTKAVRCIELNEEYNSINECAMALDILQSGICHCLSGRIPTYRGFTFEYI